MLEPPIQDKRRWWQREDLLLLILIGVFFLLPGLHRIPLFDRDEPRFAVAARTMMETGDYLVPRFNGQLRPDKPPLVYWLMNIGYLLTGGPSELGARLPSAVCGTITLFIVYFMVGSRFGRITGCVAAMMLGTSSLFLVESRLATADGAMVMFITLCMACAWRAWDAAGAHGESGSNGGRLARADYLLDRSGDRAPMMLDHLAQTQSHRMPIAMAMLFWVSLAGGTLAKGVPLVFALVPMLILTITTGALPGQLRQWRSHFHLTRGRVGVALAITVSVIVYVVAITSAQVLPETRNLVIILGIVLVGMLLTPGLPGILVRCVWHANWRWWRQLRPLIGVPLLIALVAWWVILAGRATNWQLIQDMVGNHFLNRVAGPLLEWMGIHILDTTSSAGAGHDPMRSYGQPPGFYLLTVWGTFWPWSVLLIPAAYHVIRRVRGKLPVAIDPRPYQFLLAWIVPMWILLELARGKLFHYPLPVFVPLAILCADTLVQSWNRMTDVLSAPWFGAARWGVLVIWCALGIGVVWLGALHPNENWLWRCMPFGLGLVSTGFVSAITWGRPSWPYVLVLCWGGSLMLANTMILPDLPELQVSPLVGKAMKERVKENPVLKLGVCGYEEATLVFYSGARVKRFDITSLLKEVPFGPERDPEQAPYLIAVDEPTRQELDRLGLAYMEVTRADFADNLRERDIYRIRGFNPAKFKPVTVTLISNRIPPPPTQSSPATQTVPATSSMPSPEVQR